MHKACEVKFIDGVLGTFIYTDVSHIHPVLITIIDNLRNIKIERTKAFRLNVVTKSSDIEKCKNIVCIFWRSRK